MHLRIQEAKLGLTIPILHDTSQAATLLMYNGTLGRGRQSKEIEKRNKEGGNKERVKKSLMTLFIGQNLVS